MKCTNHHYEPLYRSPFHVLEGASWAIEYCKCGMPQWHLVNPRSSPPEDQPRHVTHAVPRPIPNMRTNT